ncbi:MAG: lactate racemase domain-containing protein, partial [Aureliella sp.]
MTESLPRFFRLRQSFPRPRVEHVTAAVMSALAGCIERDLGNQTVAITVGSRGIAGVAEITRACVDFLKQRRARPFLVPAMGSHGGATDEGQADVLARFGITQATMGCPVRSSMDVAQVATAAEGFPVFFDRLALSADHVLVVNRVKPHTRFAGDIESGLMKMMLIGLGKRQGAEVYHRVIHNYSFDQIVRSVAHEVIKGCRILAGLAILENAYEETAEVVGVAPDEIEAREPELLGRVKSWMPRLPFDRADLLIVDQIGKNISGAGMDTNVIGRKRNDHAAIDGETPNVHNIYVRGLTEATHGNASGIGLAELCHRRVVEAMDRNSTHLNCITAGHVTAAMLPIDFATDRQALVTACQLAGYIT